MHHWRESKQEQKAGATEDGCWLAHSDSHSASFLKEPRPVCPENSFFSACWNGPSDIISNAQSLTDMPSDQPDKDNYIQLRLFSGDPRLCRVDDQYTEMLHPSITVKHTLSKCKITMHIFAPLNAAFLGFTYAWDRVIVFLSSSIISLKFLMLSKWQDFFLRLDF